MLKKLIGKLVGRNQRYWTESEIRELIATGSFEDALSAIEALYPSTQERELRQLCLRGEIAFRQHRDDEANELYALALKQAPGFPDAHHGMSLLMHEKGQYDLAFKHGLFAMGSNPAEPRYLAQLALCHICLGNYPQAEELLRRALHQAPGDKSAWNNLGLTLLSKGRLTEARSCFVNALRIAPHFTEARLNLTQLDTDAGQIVETTRANALENGFDLLLASDSGASLKPTEGADAAPWHTQWDEICDCVTQGSPDRALSGLEALLLKHPDSDELAVLADRLYRGLGEADSGLAVLQAFLIRQPDSPVGHQGMGEALLQLGDYATAQTHLQKAKTLGAHNETLSKALGRALAKQDKYADALPVYQECQTDWPSEVNLAYLAVAHYQACDYEQSLSYFEQLKPGNRIAILGLQPLYAMCLAYGGEVEQAAAIMDDLLARPGQASSMLRMARAAMHLQLENFGPGWDGYRFRSAPLASHRVLPVPEWEGEDIRGKTIVVLAEQGLGDQVMFASCLPDLLALTPARVVVESIVRVAPTLERSFPQCEFIATQQDRKMEWLREIEGVDCYVPLAELPRHFRRNLESFPRQAYLRPSPERVKHWRTRLEELGPGPYLGTSWRGGTESTRTAIRTLSPGLLQPLTSAIPSRWICLQYGNVKEELTEASASGVEMTHWPEAIADLDEFAALVSALDGVFTVCNTTVHYAGAVGQRTWVLAPTVPEWRYGLRNSHMPWYPHVEVLRQPAPNAWPEVISLAKQRLLDNYCPNLSRPN